MQEGKQVVYLVPTTILAQQHYNTFIQRFKDFPVRVDLMSRFRTQAQQKKTVEDLKKGLVDIVIGTHRVLSKDVGCVDADSNANPKNTSYEFNRNSRYECA